jgi:NADPH:quinone reductase-like Zn-dependent oxidoreductase
MSSSTQSAERYSTGLSRFSNQGELWCLRSPCLIRTRLRDTASGPRSFSFRLRLSVSLIADMLDAGRLKTHVGEVLPLNKASLAHEMLAGKSHSPGKIVLVVD